MKLYLNTYLDSTQYNISELADLIVAQEEVGSIIKADSNEDAFGFLTVLNLHKLKVCKFVIEFQGKLFIQDKQCIQEIKKFMLSRVNEKEKKVQLQNILEDESKSLGLIVNERMINLPAVLAPPLHKSLFDDMAKAIEYDKEVTLPIRYFSKKKLSGWNQSIFL